MTRIEFEPHSKLNVLFGGNGRGKTSILESLGYLALLRSFRDAKIDELVQWNQRSARIEATLSDFTAVDPWRSEVNIGFQKGPTGKFQRRATLNGKLMKSSSAYLDKSYGQHRLIFHAVSFNPSDHALVQGEPVQRRNYLDRVIASTHPEHLEIFRRYGKLLEQKNALLKQEDSGNWRTSALEGFNHSLSQLGAQLIYSRIQWLYAAQQELPSFIAKIAKKQAKISLDYRSKWAPLEMLREGLSSGLQGAASLELFEKNLRNKFTELASVERLAKTTLVGPHRDDWGFHLGDRELKGHGSQGEVRSVLLGLKIYEVESFKRRLGTDPIFLLDDFSSELDDERRLVLIRYLLESELQVFVTTTDETLSLEGQRVGKRFRVNEGSISEVDS